MMTLDISVAYNDVITLCDVNYNQCIPNTWEFSILITLGNFFPMVKSTISLTGVQE